MTPDRDGRLLGCQGSDEAVMTAGHVRAPEAVGEWFRSGSLRWSEALPSGWS